MFDSALDAAPAFASLPSLILLLKLPLFFWKLAYAWMLESTLKSFPLPLPAVLCFIQLQKMAYLPKLACFYLSQLYNAFDSLSIFDHVFENCPFALSLRQF